MKIRQTKKETWFLDPLVDVDLLVSSTGKWQAQERQP